MTGKKKIADFPKEIEEFLKHHNIDESEVYDASGMPTWEYKDMMSLYGYKVAIGVTPCKAYGHRLRSSKGHCVICKPEVLNYRSRYKLSGFVYIAQSTKSQLIKVGMTSKDSAQERVAILNTQGYGGNNDWTLVKSRYCRNMGYVENQIKNQFKEHLNPIEFFRTSSWELETSTEIFNCDLDEIVGYFLSLKE